MVKRAWRYLLWVLPAAVLGYAIWYTLGRRYYDTYVDGFVGDLLATVVGLIVGVPVALAISAWEQREQAREEKDRQEKAEADRRAQVLQLIRTELVQNLNRVILRKSVLESEHWRVDLLVASTAGYKDEMWRALSDGGHVGCIRDLELLDTITQTYHWVGLAKHALHTLWDLYWGTGSGRKAGEAPTLQLEALRDLLAGHDETLKDSIDHTLQRIDRALEDLGRHPVD